MALPKNLFTPAFGQQKLGLLFAAVMAIMVYLATLAVAMQAAVSSGAVGWESAQQNRVTIEIPASPNESETPQAERLKAVTDKLKTSKTVKSFTLVPASETARLLQPWIRDVDLLASLPLPVMIDAELATENGATTESLHSELTSAVADVRIDDHSAWLSDLRRVMHGLGLVAWVMIGLTAATLMIAVGLICRAAMAVEQKTIELLHLLGATDKVIAAHFTRHAQRLAWPAALIGFALAVLTLGSLALLLQKLLAQSAAPAPLWLTPLIGMALVPMLAGIGALFTARYAAMRLLRQLT